MLGELKPKGPEDHVTAVRVAAADAPFAADGPPADVRPTRN